MVWFFLKKIRTRLVWKSGPYLYELHINDRRSCLARWRGRRAKFMVRSVTNQHLLIIIIIIILIQMHRLVAVVVRITQAVVHLIPKVQTVRTSGYFYDLGHSLKYRIVYQRKQPKIINLRMHSSIWRDGRKTGGVKYEKTHNNSKVKPANTYTIYMHIIYKKNKNMIRPSSNYFSPYIY